MAKEKMDSMKHASTKEGVGGMVIKEESCMNDSMKKDFSVDAAGKKYLSPSKGGEVWSGTPASKE